MGKRVPKNQISYDILEFIAPIKETDKNDWVKGVARISWNGEPSTVDIRNMNLSQNKAYRGISLSDEEADTLTNILLDNGYGDMDSIKKAISTRKSMYSPITKEELNEHTIDDSENIVIEISL